MVEVKLKLAGPVEQLQLASYTTYADLDTMQIR